MQSSPINFILQIGESKKINFTSEYYSLIVSLEELSKNNATISIKQIKESIVKNQISQDNNAANSTSQNTLGTSNKDINLSDNSTYDYKLIFILVILLVCVGFAVLFIVKSKYNKNIPYHIHHHKDYKITTLHAGK